MGDHLEVTLHREKSWMDYTHGEVSLIAKLSTCKVTGRLGLTDDVREHCNETSTLIKCYLRSSILTAWAIPAVFYAVSVLLCACCDSNALKSA